MPLSSVYYIAEIDGDGGERIVVTDSIESAKANLRYGYDRAILVKRPRGKRLLVREPMSIDPNNYQYKRTSKVLQYAQKYGQSRRNRRAA